MKRFFFFIVVSATLALAACSAGRQAQSIEPVPPSVESDVKNTGDGFAVVGGPGIAVGADSAGMPAEMPAPSTGAYAPEGQVAQDATIANTAGDRLVIKNASLSIIVDNPSETVDTISKMAEAMGGFVVSLNTYNTTYGPNAEVAQQANMTIRVPSDRLTEALDKIKSMAVEVNNETVSGQDVTSEYTDLQSRLRNLEAAERQLQSIMEEATKTEDVLVVYQQLTYTREQIEVIKGQMKYYEQSATFSAITLDVIPNVVTQPIEVGGWHPEGAAKEAIEDTARFLQNASDGLIYFGIAYLPFLLLFGLPVLLVGRWGWKKVAKMIAPKPTAN